jgi:hypothetical protein
MEDLYPEHDKALDLLITLKEELNDLAVKALLEAASSYEAIHRLIPSLTEARTANKTLEYAISLLEEDKTSLELGAENKRNIRNG